MAAIAPDTEVRKAGRRVLNRDPGLKILDKRGPGRARSAGPGQTDPELPEDICSGGSSPRLCSMAPDSAGGESREAGRTTGLRKAGSRTGQIFLDSSGTLAIRKARSLWHGTGA